MRAYLHRSLLLLLMLVLPLQALAAASMLDCAFLHQAVQEPMAMADEPMAGCHEPEQPGAPSSEHNCKHCPVCALASALPITASDRVTILPAPYRFSSQPVATLSGYIPDGPERPPRLSHA